LKILYHKKPPDSLKNPCLYRASRGA
jgi:hypothetical protein